MSIPKATGSYLAAPRGLIESPAFLALSTDARLLLYSLERMVAASGAAVLAPALVTVYAGLDPTEAATELEAAGWLYRDADWWILPHVLDMVKGKARGRVIWEVRQLPEAVQCILRKRHRWVMGRRAKDGEDSREGARLRVTDAGARNPARNKQTNKPTNRKAERLTGGGLATDARATPSDPGGSDSPRFPVPGATPANQPYRATAATDNDPPGTADLPAALSALADLPGDRANGATGEKAGAGLPGDHSNGGKLNAFGKVDRGARGAALLKTVAVASDQPTEG